MKIKVSLFLIISLLIFILSCDDENSSNELPTCSITSPGNATSFVQGEIISIIVDSEDNEGTISEVRFYIDDVGIGSAYNFPFKFEWNTSDMSVGTHIIKAQAYDKDGGTKSDEINISIGLTGSFIDSRDGEEYSIVKIGSQIWMQENLNYDIESGCWEYEYNSSYSEIYGRIYNWTTASDACPDGWHLPTDSEWMELEISLGMSTSDAEDYGFRGSDEGGKLKETGTSHWESPNYGATNESKFKALPGGGRNNYDDFFFGLGTNAYFWTSTNYGGTYSWLRELSNEYQSISRYAISNSNGASVRCVMD